MKATSFVAEPGKQEIVITRYFDAPKATIFKIFTDAKLIPQWWGPRELTTTVDKFELRKGGIWRYVQRNKAGEEFAFNGVYHEVSPQQIVYTFEWEGMPGHVLMGTTKFEDEDGGTKVTETSVFQTIEDRDGMVKMGMKDGAVVITDRINELLAK